MSELEAGPAALLVVLAGAAAGDFFVVVVSVLLVSLAGAWAHVGAIAIVRVTQRATIHSVSFFWMLFIFPREIKGG
jgi:hypothetical protein